jgi:hypothetical protein
VNACLILEGGDWRPREARSWEVASVIWDNRYVPPIDGIYPTVRGSRRRRLAAFGIGPSQQLAGCPFSSVFSAGSIVALAFGLVAAR